ncbi:helix-turn-helix transcriptional regulator [Gemmatimonadota bacterium]
MPIDAIFRETQLFDEREVSQLLRLSVQTLRNWRCIGRGPKYLKINGYTVRYRAVDIQNFLSQKDNEQVG